MRKLILSTLAMSMFLANAQTSDSAKTEVKAEAKAEAWKTTYRATATKINDLLHTKLEVSFDFSRSHMEGKAWITLHPHFYTTDSLDLDAKGMDIHEVSLVRNGGNIPLAYTYDSMNLHITLNRTYKPGENYTVFIKYTAKPEERKYGQHSKGLYFINPTGKEKDKPTQIWTQGEQEANSVWFPTIDKPNQKTTEEISITVPVKYVTLSNGLLISQKTNADGTRTDSWKMDLPHAPYLFCLAVGDYAIVKDNYKGKEVNYYVEKKYIPYARRIYGNTPEMIAFYSRITGVEYPWPKYSQIAVRDFVEGAMENTTATIHAEAAQQDGRQLKDGNTWEWIIAHELFHQWFGDYVTTESWSNITLNETFADYSEVMWNEYKYGKEVGDQKNYEHLNVYLGNPDNVKKDLVRFYYEDNQDMFDDVSYQKGGCILHMLRNYVGDSAFFSSLHLYLTTNKFKSAEAQNLRLAFEEITGQDLNWFWNQWYYGSGHPKLDISYGYDGRTGQAKVFVQQTQTTGKVFKLPVAIDVYEGDSKQRYKVWIEHMADTFSFPVKSQPELINVDGDKVLLCEKTDHKTLDNFTFQYVHAGLYVDKMEAVQEAVKDLPDPQAFELLKMGLKDPFDGIRLGALDKLGSKNDTLKRALEPEIAEIAAKDPRSLPKANAISILGGFKKPAYKQLFLDALNDSSYSVAGTSLVALAKLDTPMALQKAQQMKTQLAEGALKDAITGLLISAEDEAHFDDAAGFYNGLPVSGQKFHLTGAFINYLDRVKAPDLVKKGVDMVVAFRDAIPENAPRSFTDPFINNLLKKLAEQKTAEGLKEQADYILSKAK